MKSKMVIIEELRKEFRDSKIGLTAEEQRPIQEKVFKACKEHGIQEDVIYYEEPTFELLKSKIK